MTDITREVFLGGRLLEPMETMHYDLACRAARWVTEMRQQHIENYGEPDSDVWPVAFHQAGERPYKEHYSLLWLTGTCVVLEDYYPTQGRDGNGWYRRVTDFDTVFGDLVLEEESDRSKREERTNALTEVHEYSNAPGVYVQQLDMSLSTLALAKYDFSGPYYPEQINF